MHREDNRTVLTSLTTFLAAVTLLVFGGSALEGFAFALTVGIVIGTYSTTYIAAALVVDWTIYAERRAKYHDLKKRRQSAKRTPS